MGLWEFLRQWQGSRHATGITVSIVVHALLLAALFTNNPFFALSTPGTKRGDALIVDLKSDPEPAAPGNASPPPAAPPQSPSPPPRPAATARPSPSPKPAPATRTPAPPAPAVTAPPRTPDKPAPVATPPTPAVEKPTPVATPPTPAPEKPAPPAEPPPRVASVPLPPAPPAPEPPAPQVTDATPTPPAPAPTASPPPRAAEAAPPSSAPTASPSGPAGGSERQVASTPPGVNAPPAGQAYVPDVRSLRPGAGGAHGLAGSGRGGVEGDPVALDTSDPRYGDYLARVKLAIERNMIYPCVKDPHGRCDYKPAQLSIEFGIKKDGNLAFIQVRHPAAYQVFDDVSANAVKLATFPPMPEALRRIHPTGLPILARFRYETALSLNSIIR